MPISQTIRTQLLQSLRAKSTVFVAGAGLTLSATDDKSTSWAGLLDDGILTVVDLDPKLRSTWQQSQRRLLKSTRTSDWLELAENVSTELKKHAGNQYGRWLERTTGSYAQAIVRPSLPEVLGAFGLPILTTNYDDVLETVTGRTPITFRQPERYQAELAQPGQHIVHIHGHWAEPDDVVFGYTSYAAAIGDTASQNLVHALAAIRQLVFVGFGAGMADPNFTSLGTWLVSRLPGNRNPPIVLTTDSSFEEFERLGRQQGFLTGSVGPDHLDLDILLSDLRRDAGILPTKTVDYGWDAMQSKLPRLARRIHKDFAPQVIVSMSGPGTTVAALCLRHFGDDPALAVAVTFPKLPVLSKFGREFASVGDDADLVHIETTRWHIYLPNFLRHYPPGTRALILDDRVVGGNSQKRAADVLRGLGFDVKTAALVVHPDMLTEVDYFEEMTEHDFTFPWGSKWGRNDPPVRPRN